MDLVIGFADFLFIGLFFACFTQFKIASQKTMWVLIGFLTAYMIVVAVTATPLPALVPIAAVILGMNLKHFKYERSEAFALLYAGLIVVSVLGWFAYSSVKNDAKNAAQNRLEVERANQLRALKKEGSGFRVQGSEAIQNPKSKIQNSK